MLTDTKFTRRWGEQRGRGNRKTSAARRLQFKRYVVLTHICRCEEERIGFNMADMQTGSQVGREKRGNADAEPGGK